ncbi:carbohydrate ABC transporter permease [Catenulispora subtropica]|uniref:carbohydrate ABC transporter permease n=1 Tax=Catenulispora subtropica TaxID=450798 RepID=UPI003CD098EA
MPPPRRPGAGRPRAGSPRSPSGHRRRFRSKAHGSRAGWPTYLILAAVVIVSAFPFYWTFVAASTSNAAINRTPPNLVPGHHFMANVRAALANVPLARAIVNSALVSAAVAAGTAMVGTLAGFAFAKLRFRGRRALFLVILATMMVPYQIGIVPLFVMMARIHMVNRLPAVVLPGLVSAFGVFFLRQYLSRALPDELLESARIDGAGNLRVFVSVVLPLARPAMAVLGLLTFMGTWNDFFWPILVLSRDDPTTQVAIGELGRGYVPDVSVILAGTLLGTLPVLVVFVVLGRQIVSGIMHGGVKG